MGTLFLLAGFHLALGHKQTGSISDAELKAAVTEYVSFDLPLAPTNASLAIVRANRGRGEFLAYVDSERLAYLGASKSPIGNAAITRLPEAVSAIDNAMSKEPFQAGLNLDTALANAIQAAHRGKFDLARGFLSLRDLHPAKDLFSSNATDELGNRIATMAFNHYAMAIPQPGADWPGIARELDKIAESGFLPSTATKPRRLLDGLHLSMSPAKSPSWSVERLVDDLVEANITSGQFFSSDDARFDRIADLGYACIPIAIEHLGDIRLTHSLFGGGGPEGPSVLTIDDFMYSFLLQASGGELLQARAPLTREVAEAWWDKQRALSEEQFWLEHVFVQGGNWPASPAYVIQQIAKKYPGRLPELYAEAIQKPGSAHMTLSMSIAESTETSAEKSRILLAGTRAPDFMVRAYALQALERVDSKLSRSELVQTIKDIPDQWPTDSYGEGHVARRLQFSRDSGVWDVFEKRVKGLEPRYRLILLQELLLYRNASPKPALEMISELFDLRDAKYPAPKPFPANRFDFYVARRIGGLEGMVDQPRDNDTAGWEEYTKEVRRRITRLMGR